MFFGHLAIGGICGAWWFAGKGESPLWTLKASVAPLGLSAVPCPVWWSMVKKLPPGSDHEQVRPLVSMVASGGHEGWFPIGGNEQSKPSGQLGGIISGTHASSPCGQGGMFGSPQGRPVLPHGGGPMTGPPGTMQSMSFGQGGRGMQAWSSTGQGGMFGSPQGRPVLPHGGSPRSGYWGSPGAIGVVGSWGSPGSTPGSPQGWSRSQSGSGGRSSTGASSTITGASGAVCPSKAAAATGRSKMLSKASKVGRKAHLLLLFRFMNFRLHGLRPPRSGLPKEK